MRVHHLRPAGNSRPNQLPELVIWNRPLKHTAKLRTFRSRPHKSSCPLKDVHDLRQFVNSNPAANAPDARNAAVVFARPSGAGIFASVCMERNLYMVNSFPPSPTFLPMDHRSTAVQFNKHRHEKHDWRGTATNLSKSSRLARAGTKPKRAVQQIKPVRKQFSR